MSGWFFLGRIVAYQVQNNGFYDPVAFKKENLQSSEVFIIVDDGRKELWIWIGEEADVRSRFISSTVAAEIRRIYGLSLRIRAADQGAEPADFWKCLDSVPDEGLGPIEAIDKTELIPPEPPVLDASKPKPSQKVIVKTPKKKTETKTELITPSPPVPDASKTELPKRVIEKSTKILKKLKKTEQEDIKPLPEYIEAKPSLITTPPCPNCKRGHLLPYSEIVDVSKKEKQILPFSRWSCSNCNYSPDDSAS